MVTTISANFTKYDPRKNLPFYSSYKNGEFTFLSAFKKQLQTTYKMHGFLGTNFSVPGYGIADCILLNLPRTKNCFAHLTAFELKLKDWKRALMQAYVYSYFADQSIVVLPPRIENTIKLNLGLFQKLGIGVWIFDTKKEVIKKIYCPSDTKALSPSARKKAFNLFSTRFNFSNSFESKNSFLDSK